MMTLKAYLHGFRSFSNWSATLQTVRRMSTTGTDHLTRTASNIRQEIVTEGIVKDIENLSGTVKRLTLQIQDRRFTFKAGQWVDMFIPGIETVGGFSMCSPPHLLSDVGQIHLAIKFSNHPPAAWVHRKCQIGSKVQLRAGGDFYYDPQPRSEHSDLLLVAGGVGINPLYSMLQHFVHLHPGHLKSREDSHGVQDKSITMLYSARNTEELIFKTDLVKIANSLDNVNLKLFCTREAASETKNIVYRRIQFEDVKSALDNLDKSNTEVYVCGPLPFIEAIQLFCAESNLSQNKVYFEKWW